MTPEAFHLAARRLLDEVTTMTVATCAGGIPWASDVYFAPDGYDLVFFSSPDSRHGRNLAAHPVCAATVHPLAATWREIRGLQIEGEVHLADTLAAKTRALAAYLGKFPFARELMAHPGEAASKMARVSAHVFRPRRIRYLDNALGFGARYAVCLKDGAPVGPPEREESA